MFTYCVLTFTFFVMIKCCGINTCNDDPDCDTKGSICFNSACICPAGYVINSDKTKCLLESTGFGGNCEDNVQCSAVLQAGGQCSNSQCSCVDGFHYLRGQCIRSVGLGEPCRNDDHCFSNYDFESTVCKNNKCQCSEGYYQREYSACRRASYAPGEPCGIAQDCRFEDAVCTMGRLCDFQNTSQPTPPSIFQNFSEAEEIISYNKINEVESNGLSECNIIYAMKLGERCNRIQDCAPLPNSYCNANRKCECLPGFYSSDNFESCLPELGSPCSKDANCQGRNTMCRNCTWCACRPGFVASPNNRRCLKMSRNIGWSCLHDEQCSFFGTGGRCVNKKCTCAAGTHFEESHLFCWRSRTDCSFDRTNGYKRRSVRVFDCSEVDWLDIGEACLSKEDCWGEGTNCSDGLCKCISGYHTANNDSECRKDAILPGDTCTEESDCVFEHSTCKDGYCQCSIGYFNQLNQCLKGIGGTCVTNGDCSASNSVCEENSCLCPANFIASSDNSKCLALVNILGGPCLEQAQCSKTMGSKAACANKKCNCQDGSHFVLYDESDSSSGQCYEDVKLGESCTQTHQCIEQIDGNLIHSKRILCRKGICSCDFKYAYDAKNNVCKDNGNSVLPELIMILFTISTSFMIN